MTTIKTKDVVSAGLVAAMTIGSEKLLSKYSKNKMANTVASVAGSFLALEYLRDKNMVPVVGGIDINRKSSKKSE